MAIVSSKGPTPTIWTCFDIWHATNADYLLTYLLKGTGEGKGCYKGKGCYSATYKSYMSQTRV